MEIPAAWATDVEVLRLEGAVIEDQGDHLVVRSPRNPGYHWGNFLLVGDAASRDDAQRWVAAFDAEFPDAEHVAIGLPAQPSAESWSAHGLAVSEEVVLRCEDPCEPVPLPAGYAVRRLVTADDWAQLVAADEADNRATGQFAAGAYRDFATRFAAVRSEMVQRGVAAFLGACTEDGTLVARLGVVLCPGQRVLARFQHVGTVPQHQGRGLASHLLGEAAQWAQHQGAEGYEIHADPGSAGQALYERRGFAVADRAWRAYRAG